MTPHFVAAGIPPSQEDPMRRLRMRFDCASLVLLDGKPIGVLKTDRSGAPWQLIQILLDPAAQGKGLGTRLIRSVIAEAQSRYVALVLSVLKGNPAMALYRRLGFNVVAEERHAYTMRLEPPPPAPDRPS